MIHDRRLKQAALQYIVSKNWFPQLELGVQVARSASKKSYDITDIDVYGAVPDEFNAYRSVLFDCKSGRHESAITRAMWLKGLMAHFQASWGICILNDDKDIKLDHREAAIALGISLMTMSEFTIFSRATDGDLADNSSHVADIDKWNEFFQFQIRNQYKNLQPVIDFSSKKYWTLANPSDAVRRSIALLRSRSGEFDPSKKEHLVIFGDILALFLFALGQVGHRLFKAYLQPKSRQDLDTILLPYIYGGQEAYSLINDLNSIISRQSNSSIKSETYFPEWDLFVQLLRSILDAPMQALHAPLLSREIAWSFFDNNPDLTFAKKLANNNRQAGKYCLQGTNYLVAAAKLPPEFSEKFQNIFLNIQSTPSSNTTHIQRSLSNIVVNAR